MGDTGDYWFLTKGMPTLRVVSKVHKICAKQIAAPVTEGEVKEQ